MQWEETAALHRDHAAKQAELAAAELSKLSSRMANQKDLNGSTASSTHTDPSAPSSSSASGGSPWGLKYIMDLLTSFLLNRLHLSINNVHIYFKVSTFVCFHVSWGNEGLDG